MSHPAPVVEATTPITHAPAWAVLQRELFALLDEGRRRFERLYCADDGSLVYAGRTFGRDGVDDFYEPFFNWPALYVLGGADDLLEACKHHWRGVTAQLTRRGLLTGEFENGYDWFHQGESLLFFYGICAADPDDEEFRRRASRFADLYLPDSPAGNYDRRLRMMRAPHVGALGPRPGLAEDRPYSAANLAMAKYGLPLRDVPGIGTWADLEDPANARRMAEEMNRRLGTGDVAMNLAVTSLVTNAWLYDHDERYSRFVTEYVGAWQERAAANHGLIPDNVGPGGTVGELHGGRWFGGHYGWSWPHGLYSVVAPALIGAINATLVSGVDDPMSLPRQAVRAALEHARRAPLDPQDAAFFDHWYERLGDDVRRDLLLVPYRRDAGGWFDYQPLPPAYPAWLWWVTRRPGDQAVLADLADRSGYDWRQVRGFREKEEAGHEPPWYRYLAGDNDDYPEQALSMAIAQVRRRLELMERHPAPPPDDDIHWWQGLNPVVTEVLTQLVAGAPQMLYNGGLPLAQLRWADADRGRPGLPDQVAALVERLDGDTVTVRVLNLHASATRTLSITGGGYGEHPITAAETLPGPGRPADTARTGRVLLRLAPRTQTRLRLRFARFGRPARHQRRPSTTTGA
ncbi:hypothetical protein Sme01_58520 [Sphaerisporangium melleum]|uniref:Uncharacterized protein n=1 Tax=Sphaerisporangium melleum TaxID=321316 RepID=A0A917R7H5_9ACTN|nr:hypothetical protein [Sphaerisporangium melleum]GGK93799.1 hypothetical protein GCM10007964_40250 [Sphaerisporangium melleum]GII73376.1 hypothetical protein Sme01_58520 [Sphaerisporangium melleum]